MAENESDKESGGKGATPQPTPTQPPQQGQVAIIITELTKIMETAVKIRKNAKDLVEIEEVDIKRVIQALRRVQEPENQDIQEQTLSRLLTNTEEIKKRMTIQGSQSAKTWSQIAAGNTTKLSPTTQIRRQQAEERRRDREIVVTIIDQQQREATNKKPTEAILKAIQVEEPRTATEDIIALRNLPSGDYQATTATEQSRKTLEESKEWLQAIAPSATIKRRTYTIRAHGVRIQAIDMNKQDESLIALQ